MCMCKNASYEALTMIDHCPPLSRVLPCCALTLRSGVRRRSPTGSVFTQYWPSICTGSVQLRGAYNSCGEEAQVVWKDSRARVRWYARTGLVWQGRWPCNCGMVRCRTSSIKQGSPRRQRAARFASMQYTGSCTQRPLRSIQQQQHRPEDAQRKCPLRSNWRKMCGQLVHLLLLTR